MMIKSKNRQAERQSGYGVLLFVCKNGFDGLIAVQVDQQFLNSGDGGNGASNGGKHSGAGQANVEGNGKNGKAGQFIHVCVKRSKGVMFERKERIGNDTQQYSDTDHDPNADGKTLPEGREDLDHHHGIEGKIGNAVQLCAEFACVVCHACDPTVKQVADTAECIQNEKPKGESLGKEHPKSADQTKCGNYVWQMLDEGGIIPFALHSYVSFSDV